MSQRMRDGKIAPRGLEGGTFSISSLGGIAALRSLPSSTFRRSRFSVSSKRRCTRGSMDHHSTAADVATVRVVRS